MDEKTPETAEIFDEEYEAIVYDLDGTLVYLNVDWNAVASDVLAVYRDEGVEPPSTELWTLLGRASAHGLRDRVEEAIAVHEREGARTSQRLALADQLRSVSDSMPVAVCSLNCEAACEIALETHDLREHVDVIVGRDTVDTYKPDPKPLLTAIDRLGGSPATTLFVGDSERDATTADRASVSFRWVDRS